MPGRVEGKVALVVGGGQTAGATIGNGRATAELLAREGARVAVADLRLQAAQETVDQIKKDGGDAIALQVDVTSEASCKKLVEDTLAHYGRLDILHNNVGGSLALGDAPVDDITTEAWDRIINVNLRGMVYTAKFALPAHRLQDNEDSDHRPDRESCRRQREVQRSRQRHSPRQDQHTHGDRAASGDGPQPGRGRRLARCHGAAGRQDGHGLGRREGRLVPALRRCGVYHGRFTAGRWR
jgi:NAD(P)-dependent dehydrogenase (short-subunit alcohol dehydrogenase family)